MRLITLLMLAAILLFNAAAAYAEDKKETLAECIAECNELDPAARQICIDTCE